MKTLYRSLAACCPVALTRACLLAAPSLGRAQFHGLTVTNPPGGAQMLTGMSGQYNFYPMMMGPGGGMGMMGMGGMMMGGMGMMGGGMGMMGMGGGMMDLAFPPPSHTRFSSQQPPSQELE
jgi:hypothetical protein